MVIRGFRKGANLQGKDNVNYRNRGSTSRCEVQDVVSMHAHRGRGYQTLATSM
jgi:hypothetical protein